MDFYQPAIKAFISVDKNPDICKGLRRSVVRGGADGYKAGKHAGFPRRQHALYRRRSFRRIRSDYGSDTRDAIGGEQ